MKPVALEQRLVGAAVGVGVGRQEVMAVVAVQHQQIEPHAGGRLAVHGVEDMGGQACFTRHARAFLLRSVDYQK